MKEKPVVPRAVAHRDVETAIDYYLEEAGKTVAEAFVDAIAVSYLSIARRPRLGSLRYGYELAIPGLRCRRVAKYPYLIFYFERENHIDVWRVLHERRDIPRTMTSRVGR